MSRIKATLKIDNIVAYDKFDKKAVIDWDVVEGDKELQETDLSSAFLYENLEVFLDSVDCRLDNVKSLRGKTVTAKLYKNKSNNWLVDPATIKLVNSDDKSEVKLETKPALTDNKQEKTGELESSIVAAANAASVYDEASAKSARLLNKYLHDTLKHIKILIDNGFPISDVGKTLVKLHTDASYLEFKLNSLKEQE